MLCLYTNCPIYNMASPPTFPTQKKCGIINQYNTCSLNSVFQLLRGTQPWAMINQPSMSDCAFCNRLYQIVVIMYNPKYEGKTFNIVTLWDMLGLTKGEQEDASTIISLVLSHLTECNWKFKPNSQIKPFSHVGATSASQKLIQISFDTLQSITHKDNPFVNFFSVGLTNESVCSSCRFNRRWPEHSILIQTNLPIDKSFISLQDDILQKWNKTERSNDYYCEECKQTVTMLTKQCVACAPRFLFVSVNRTLIIDSTKQSIPPNAIPINGKNLFGVKNTIPIIGTEINISNAHIDKTFRTNLSYVVLGGILHHGNSIDSGHYTVLIRSGAGWFHYNDTHIDILSFIDGEHMLRNAVIYLLFRSE